MLMCGCIAHFRGRNTGWAFFYLESKADIRLKHHGTHSDFDRVAIFQSNLSNRRIAAGNRIYALIIVDLNHAAKRPACKAKRVGSSGNVFSNLIRSGGNRYLFELRTRNDFFEQFSVQSKKLIESVFGEEVSISKKAEQHLHIFQ